VPDVIKLENQFYIRSTSPVLDDRIRVLKSGNTLGIFDRYGDIERVGPGSHGLYRDDTRFLSSWVLRLANGPLQLLSSTLNDRERLLTVNLANADIVVDGQVAVRRETLHIFRTKFLCDDTCYEHLKFWNYGLVPVEVSFSFFLTADFVDMFEIRGTLRERRGQRLSDLVERDQLVFSYAGLDGVLRRTRVHCSPEPVHTSASKLDFQVRLEPRGHKEFCTTVTCESGASPPPVLSYRAAHAKVQTALQASRNRTCTLATSDEEANRWLDRSTSDLDMMLTDTDGDPYPYAGVPWFNAPFGRDGIITALECLWMNPWIARGVLDYLAATQARESNPATDAEPGKILHETRKGEMAAVGEVPFARYYGSVDATPLYVLLAAEYFRRTGDLEFIQRIQPNIELALQWIDKYGDVDGDGFVEYKRKSPQGLVQQGWKDSSDSVFYADGSLVEGPVALCEVQAYVFGAKRGAAQLARALGDPQRAEQLAQEADLLQRRFEQAFWCDDLATYALALDGKKRLCRVRASNAGHCLYIGIASPERAFRLAETLLAHDSFSGWGIRTLSSRELRYNPISYHNGSVWPHDNALIAYGLARYGFTEAAYRIAAALFDVSRFVDLQRLPELFCGFARGVADVPTLYPVACSPQSWAVASVFLLAQAFLGITVSPLESPAICLDHPLLPPGVEYININNLSVGGSTVDLKLRPGARGPELEVVRQTGQVEVAVQT
jgi:glycogen debranching enzyme